MVTHVSPSQLVLPGFEHFFTPEEMPIFIDPSPQDDPPPEPPLILIYVHMNWTPLEQAA
jgi:hypothetical protein